MCSVKQLIVLILLLLGGIIAYVFSDAYYAAAFLIILILSVIAAIVIVLLSGRKITVSGSAGGAARRGEPASVTVLVSNGSRLPAGNATLNFQLRNLLTGENKPIELPISLGGKKSETIRIELPTEHCGCLTAADGVLNCGEPFGLFHKRRAADVSGSYSVLPKETGIKLTESQILQYDMESYKYSMERSGADPTETFQIREYQPGDPVKGIHWKLSAKTGQTMLREPGLPVENNILLLIDKCRDMTPDQIDDMADLALSISLQLLRKEIVHSVGWADLEGGGFAVMSIQDETSLWDCYTKFLASPCKNSEMTTVRHLLESDTEMLWSNYICLTESETDLVRLRDYGEVQSFRLSDFKAN